MAANLAGSRPSERTVSSSATRSPIVRARSRSTSDQRASASVVTSVVDALQEPRVLVQVPEDLAQQAATEQDAPVLAANRVAPPIDIDHPALLSLKVADERVGLEVAGVPPGSRRTVTGLGGSSRRVTRPF
jgi:hypothetical protein